MKTYPYKGRNLTILQVNNVTGFPIHELHRRLIDRGMTVEEALAEPLRRITLTPRAPAKPKGPPRIPRMFTHEGKTLTIRGWARATGIERATLECRLIRYEWPLERALTEPVHPTGPRALYRRNARIIARMLGTVHETGKPLQTGGYCQTFPGDDGTGVGSSNFHCEGTSA